MSRLSFRGGCLRPCPGVEVNFYTIVQGVILTATVLPCRGLYETMLGVEGSDAWYHHKLTFIAVKMVTAYSHTSFRPGLGMLAIGLAVHSYPVGVRR